MSSVTFMVATDESGVSVFDWAVISKTGVTQEQLTATFGDKVEFLTVTFRQPTYAMEQSVTRGCLVENTLLPGAFRLDETLIPVKRFTAFVKEWTRSAKISDDAFMELPPPLAGAITEAINRVLYPNTSPDFLTALNSLTADTTNQG